MKNGYKAILNLAIAALALTLTNGAVADAIDSTESNLTRGRADSTSIIAPADITSFLVLDSAEIEMTGGNIGSLNLHDNSSATISGGSISWLTLNENSAATISGGNLNWLRVYDNSSVRLTGADNLDWLVFGNSASHAEIVGSNIQYSNGQLSGYWKNGKPFSFWAITELAPPSNLMPSNIVISSVPEPSMALLMLGGIALFAARRPRKSA